jgi:predicted dienelactone hydrolase
MGQLLAASEEQTSPLADSRVKAIVTVAGDAFLFGEAGLSSVSVPTLVVGGTGDNWSPWEWGAELTYSSVASDQLALAGLEGADHMIAVNTCETLPWTDALPKEFSSALCQDAVWDRAEALSVVQSFVTAFLLDTLAGDTAAHDCLSNEAVDEADVRYEASW